MRRTVFAFLLLLPFAGYLAAGAFPWKAPAGVSLPQAVQPVTSAPSGWRQEGGVWTLDPHQPGLLDVKAWWNGNRPQRGAVVVLEIEFQDDLAHPVIAEVYSGMGATQPFSEMHRFGGAADGKWKTARVPASSDFILRFLPANSLRFRLRSDSGTLKARSFRLVAPAADEEQQWNASTRAWVAREQKRAEVPPRFFAMAQKPYLPGEWQTKPLVPYARNWMNLVRPISAPQQGETGAALRVRMFKNEFEPAQLGVYANGKDLKNVRVSVDPVKNASGAEVAQVAVRVAEFSKVKGGLVPGSQVQLYPQRLWPAYPFEVAAGSSQLVWLNVRTQDGSAVPGKYTTTVRLQADGVAPVTVPLHVEILNARLLTMEEAGLKLGGCTTGLIPEFELEFLRGQNHNMVNIWYAGVRPELSKNGDSFDMDFRIMDDWMAAAKRAGMSDMVYFLGGDPYGFPQTFNLPRTLANLMLGIDDAGWRKLAFENPYEVPSRIAPLMVEWSRRFGEHARANNWPNVILTPFDEPAKYLQYRSGLGMLSFIKPQFKEQIRLLRKGDPKAQIYGSIHHYDGGMDFLEDVDIFNTNAVFENLNMPEQVREAGKTLWEYSGTGDASLPGSARYTFGYFFAAHDSRGSLVWAYNWGNRFDTLDGNNWMYVWNTPFDVIPTPYLEGLREAWDDRRLIETVKRAAAKKGVDLTSFFGRLFTDGVATRGKGGTDTVTDFWEQASNENAMDEWKERLVRKLMVLE